jgi:hypothetical protein
MGQIKIETVADRFTAEVRRVFGEECLSVVLYGSAVTDDFDPKRSDLNFLVVLTEAGLRGLKQAQPFVGRWRRDRILFPLFMTEAGIASSLDSFPVEFFNMQLAYRVRHGKDVLGPLVLPRRELRLQCERELKGKLLRLREEYLLTQGKPKAVRNLIALSLVSFVSLFRALLFLNGKPVPPTRGEVLTEACGELHLDLALFRNLLAIRQKGLTYTKFELEDFTERYIEEIDRLCRDVDQMTAA